MKFDNWTIALAALGVVSLASAANAEEKPSAVVTALSATTISGYVDTSAQWNPGTGNANLPPYKFNGPSKADGFNLDVFQLRIERPLDETPWAAGYRVDLWAGPDANTLNTQSLFGNNSRASMGDFAIRQAYVQLNMPVGNGIDWKMGVFDSIIGYESVESPNDPNYTRSYGHSMEPQTETGITASYKFCSMFSATAGVADTIGPAINDRAQGPNLTTLLGGTPVTQAESYKTYMGSVALTAPESMGFLSGSTLYGGVVNGFKSTALNGAGTMGGDQINWYAGATVATPLAGLRLGASYDNLNVWSAKGETWAAAGYASYQATEKLSFHARGEYVKDSAGFFELNTDRFMELTGTVQYDLWKNVISRVEFRWDHSLTGSDAFGGDTAGTPTRDDAYMLAANIIYKF